MRKLRLLIAIVASGVLLAACGSQSGSAKSSSSAAIAEARTTSKTLAGELSPICYGQPSLDLTELGNGWITVECNLTPNGASMVGVEVFLRESGHRKGLDGELSPCGLAAMIENGLGEGVINGSTWTALVPIQDLTNVQNVIGGKILWPLSHGEVTENLARFPNGCAGPAGIEANVINIGVRSGKIVLELDVQNTNTTPMAAECKLSSSTKTIPAKDLAMIGAKGEPTFYWGKVATGVLAPESSVNQDDALGPGSSVPLWMKPNIFSLVCVVSSDQKATTTTTSLGFSSGTAPSSKMTTIPSSPTQSKPTTSSTTPENSPTRTTPPSTTTTQSTSALVAQWKSQFQAKYDKLKLDYASDPSYSTVDNDVMQMETLAYLVGYGLNGLPQNGAIYTDWSRLDGAIGDCGTTTSSDECSAVPGLFNTLQSDIDTYT